MIACRKWRPLTQQITLALMVAALTGCSWLRPRAKLDEPVGLIAVMPIERDEPASQPVSGEERGVAPGAEHVVTAQIYDVLSSAPQWRFVPDLAMLQALSKADLSGERALRARWLGRQVAADTVLFGTVSRFVERVGADYGAQRPAAVAIELQLISVQSGIILWKGTFDQEQTPLSSNLFNWWQFWKGGPKWFSAQEFAHVAVEHLLDELAKRMG